MAETRPIEPVIRVCALFSRHEPARRWARNRLEQSWGPVRLASDEFPFEPGSFYEPTMGTGLVKQWLAFTEIQDPAYLADWKHETNRWELEYARHSDHPEPRPLNLDPGYVTQAKLVLATTKDRDHRIYLRDGMFAEVTLSYTGRRWVDHRWTYPDYRTEAAVRFVASCREHLRSRLQAEGGWRRVAAPPNPDQFSG